ncbi:hypothetical protein A5677_08515 [Mycobacterium malmoense]|uniref:Uncharacterized protein n=1 Tax=Mycobacterium malmoense TaxID=1780 RepID=A0A1B9CJC5_MYCMA|nr:hypothetical protein A5677_08515 [Mycobacterium malmoense]
MPQSSSGSQLIIIWPLPAATPVAPGPDRVLLIDCAASSSTSSYALAAFRRDFARRLYSRSQ